MWSGFRKNTWNVATCCGILPCMHVQHTHEKSPQIYVNFKNGHSKPQKKLECQWKTDKLHLCNYYIHILQANFAERTWILNDNFITWTAAKGKCQIALSCQHEIEWLHTRKFESKPWRTKDQEDTRTLKKSRCNLALDAWIKAQECISTYNFVRKRSSANSIQVQDGRAESSTFVGEEGWLLDVSLTLISRVIRSQSLLCRRIFSRLWGTPSEAQHLLQMADKQLIISICN